MTGYNKIKRVRYADGGSLDVGPPTKVPSKQFLGSYMSSPIYKKRLQGMGITSTPDITNLMNTHIANNSGYGSFYMNQQKSKNYRDNTNLIGLDLDDSRPNINIDRRQVNTTKDLTGFPETAENALSHELSHSARNLSTTENNTISKANIRDTFPGFEHDNKPNEIKADLDTFRFMMYKKGIYDTSKRNMTIDDFNKAKSDKDISSDMIFNRLQKHLKPEDIVNLNNTIAFNSNNTSNIDQPIAAFGGRVEDMTGYSKIKKKKYLSRYADGGSLDGGPPFKRPIMQKDAIQSTIPIKNNLPDDKTKQFLDYYSKNLSKDGAEAFNSLRKENNDPSINMTNTRSNYNPWTNTLNVDTADSRGVRYNALAELAHAKQFKDDFISSAAKAVTDRILVGDNSSYHKKGTFENQAHSVIQPQLNSQYQGRQNINYAKENGLSDVNDKDFTDAAFKPITYKNGGDLMTGYSKIKKKKYLPRYAGGADFSQNDVPDDSTDFFSGNSKAISGGANFLGDTLDGFNHGGTGGGSVALGALSGGLKGAAEGTAILPGIGTAVGGAIGLASGFFSSKSKQAAAIKQRNLNQGLIASNAAGQSNQAISQYANNGVDATLYDEGGYIIGGDDPKAKAKAQAKAQPTYDGSLLLPGQDKFLVTKANGQLGQWGNNPTIPNEVPINNPIKMSDKALGYSSTYYPSAGQQTTPSVPTQYRSSYARGGRIKLDPNVEYPQFPLMATGGSIHIKKSHEGKFTAYKKRTGKTTEEALHSSDPHVRQMANFARNASKWKHAEGGEIANPQYEAEQGEMIQGQPQLEEGTQIASDMHEIGGDRHENGGTMGSGGERIFSDRLKVSPALLGVLKTNGIKIKSNDTYADASNKLAKLKGKFEDKTDGVGKTTASVMLPRIEQSLDDTFNDQEMGKQVRAFKKYATGGSIPRYTGDDLTANQTGFNIDNSINGNPVDATLPQDYTPNPSTWSNIKSSVGQFGSAVGDYVANNPGQVANAGTYLANLGTINRLNTTVAPQLLANPNYNYTDRSAPAYNRNNALFKTGVKSLTNAGQSVNASNIGALYSKELESNGVIANSEANRRDAYNDNYNQRFDRINAENTGITNKALEDSRDLYNQKLALKLGARNAFQTGVVGNIAQRQQSDLEQKKLLTVLATNDQNGVMTRFLNNYPKYKKLLSQYNSSN